MGYILGLLYCTVTALSNIAINQFEISMNPFALAFYSFFLATLFFTALNLTKISHVISIVKAHWRVFILLNIATSMAWLGTFWALKYISAQMSLLIYLITVPIGTWLINGIKRALKQSTILILNLLIIATTLFIIEYGHTAWLGVLFAFIGGWGGSIYIIQSAKLNNENLSSTQTLAVRFYFLLIISIFFLHHDVFHSSMLFHFWHQFIIAAILSCILPLFFMQHSIAQLGTQKFADLVPLIPIIAYALNLLTHHQSMNVLPLTFFMIIAIITLLKNLYGRRKNLSLDRRIEAKRG